MSLKRKSQLILKANYLHNYRLILPCVYIPPTKLYHAKMPLDQLFIVNSCGFHKKICSEILSEKKPKFTNMYNDYFKFQYFFISKFSIYPYLWPIVMFFTHLSFIISVIKMCLTFIPLEAEPFHDFTQNTQKWLTTIRSTKKWKQRKN